MQSDDNPIMELARETNTQLHAVDDTEVVLDFHGNTLPQEEARAYSELLWSNGAIADAFRYSNEYSGTIDPRKSLYDFFAEKAEAMFLDDSNEEAIRKRKAFLSMTRLWSSYVGSPVTRQSLKFFWLEECIEGENPFVAETYSKILDAVSKPAIENAKILLATEVGLVRGRASIADESLDRQGPELVTVNSEVHRFDEVIVTSPLGWLKEHKKAFEPELPQRLSDAIDSISYGHLDKVYITFPRAFWQGSDEPQQFAGPDTSNLTTPSTSSATSTSKDMPAFFHFLDPAYASETNPHRWYQNCMNYATLADCAQPTLLFYIEGDQSKYIAGIVRDTPCEQTRDKKLLEHFEPYYSRLPHFSRSDPACQPKAVLATAWANDKFAGYGSYSNFQVGLEKGDEDIEVMRHGMPDRSIWLAGEHTAPFVALGTSTGAYWSGQRVAERIIEAYGLTRAGT
jgi:hypothetical protein